MTLGETSCDSLAAQQKGRRWPAQCCNGKAPLRVGKRGQVWPPGEWKKGGCPFPIGLGTVPATVRRSLRIWPHEKEPTRFSFGSLVSYLTLRSPSAVA